MDDDQRSHPLGMSLSVTGWSVDPELLDDIAIEIFHSEQFGDEFRVKLTFKSGRVAQIEATVAEGCSHDLYDAIQREMTLRP
jgi:hypothetical protein